MSDEPITAREKCYPPVWLILIIIIVTVIAVITIILHMIGELLWGLKA